MEGSKPTPLERAGEEPVAAPVQVDRAEPVKDQGVAQKPLGAVRLSLYERMGGASAIAQVVDDFVDNVVADDRIKEAHKKHFREGDVAGLKKKLADQIGQATGGPEKYTGKDMKAAHQGLGITDEDFDALVVDLVKALDKNKVGDVEKAELLAMLGKLRPQVIEKPKEEK
jgi:hemoglobin